MIWILLVAAGCDFSGELDYRGDVPPPKLALYAYVEAGSPVRVEVERSGTYGEDKLRNVEWRPRGGVWVNGEYAGALSRVEGNMFEAPVSPRAGDRVTLRVGGEGCEEAVGETVVCAPLPPIEADTSVKAEDGLLYVDVSVPDDGGERRYYRLQTEQMTFYTGLKLSEKGQPTMQTDTFVSYDAEVSADTDGGWDLESSSIFGARRDLNPYNVFTNEWAEDGRLKVQVHMSLPAVFEQEDSLVWRGDTLPYTWRVESLVRVRLLRLDEDLYEFLRTLGFYQRQYDIYKEPTRVHTNVRGGLGVVGSCSTGEAVFEFRLPSP